MKERDGVHLPFVQKQIICNPGAPLELVIEHAGTITETVAGQEQRVLTRFLSDSSRFNKDQKPAKLLKFENIVSLNADCSMNEYLIKVWYET